ncbi:MAG: hypothetical protein GY771_13785, partial [bacterium]|nr:hypothetical protein [bacterium]
TDNQDGTYTFNNVYEGGFSVETHDTIGRGGRATGIIENNGDSVNVTVRLNETWTVTGNVFQPDNTTPAAGVPVVLYGGNGAFGNQTTGDDDGFQFQYVTEGTYWLEAEDPFTGLKGQSAAFYVNADVDTYVRIKGRGTVSGIVYDGSGTTPLASAGVSLKSSAAGSFSRDIIAEDNGSFTYELVDEGSFTLSATDPVTQLQVETTGTIDYHGHNVFINIY